MSLKSLTQEDGNEAFFSLNFKVFIFLLEYFSSWTYLKLFIYLFIIYLFTYLMLSFSTIFPSNISGRIAGFHLEMYE